ncbi:hypothetical protein CRM75_10655 [Enterococcus faecium]|nr:hypothetical protein CRM75_10655 [Enterococcus faecium]
MFDIRMPSFFFLVLSSNDVSFTTIFHFMVRNQKNIFHFLIFFIGVPLIAFLIYFVPLYVTTFSYFTPLNGIFRLFLHVIIS